ncbi:MAG: HlyD family secretion protein [Stellaceae bacterium]
MEHVEAEEGSRVTGEAVTSRSGTQQVDLPVRTLDRRSARGKAIRRTILIAALAAVIGIGLYVYFSGAGTVSTDDAFTNGRPVAVAPQISGDIVALDVTDNQFVHKGDLMVVIDPRSDIAARDQAAAGLALAQAQLANAEQSLAVAKISYPAQFAQAKAAQKVAAANLFQAAATEKMTLDLPTGVVVSQQSRNSAIATANADRATLAQATAALAAANDVEAQISQAKTVVDERKAAVKQAKAMLEQADVNFSYTGIRAPFDGWITDRAVTVGSYVQPGMTMFSLVSPNVWITANFKETKLTHMRPGQKVIIHVDAYPNLHLVGRVNSIQKGSGSVFTAFPAENATGNFVKIVQRVPVKIVITGGLNPNIPLPLGLSVEPVVHLK